MFQTSFSCSDEIALKGTYDMTSVTTMLDMHNLITFQITAEEACGYAMLAIYGINFAHVLTEE